MDDGANDCSLPGRDDSRPATLTIAEYAAWVRKLKFSHALGLLSTDDWLKALAELQARFMVQKKP